jgi:6-pyruvoyltetrahydropterin/6-carboxytetrahydropterin synthase
MYRITKRFTFEAAHRLNGLPPGHKCGEVHGHSYGVTVVLESEQLDERGFVRDYGELGILRTYIDTQLDHKFLNEVGELRGIAELQQPTAENIARHLFHWAQECWPELAVVIVSETATTSAEYRP